MTNLNETSIDDTTSASLTSIFTRKLAAGQVELPTTGPGGDGKSYRQPVIGKLIKTGGQKPGLVPVEPYSCGFMTLTDASAFAVNLEATRPELTVERIERFYDQGNARYSYCVVCRDTKDQWAYVFFEDQY